MADWISFLNSLGAQWQADSVHPEHEQLTGFQQPDHSQQLDREAHTTLCVLEHQNILSVDGPDAATFLQGQVTCNINDLASGASYLGAHCSHKGRAIFTFRAAQLKEQCIGLRLPNGLVQRAMQTLGKYIVFSKAQLTDQGGDLHCLGIIGPQAKQTLLGIYHGVPEQANQSLNQEGDLIIQTEGERFEIWTNTERSKALISQLGPHCHLAGPTAWDLSEIEQGIAHVLPGSEEMFIPQMLNYQALEGISFKKGCYTGQEIVARMQYRGKLKRHLWQAEGELEDLPPPGTALYRPNHSSNAGEVVISAKAPNQSKTQLLIVCTDDAAEGGQVLVNNNDSEAVDSQVLTVSPVPYAITTYIE